MRCTGDSERRRSGRSCTSSSECVPWSQRCSTGLQCARCAACGRGNRSAEFSIHPPTHRSRSPVNAAAPAGLSRIPQNSCGIPGPPQYTEPTHQRIPHPIAGYPQRAGSSATPQQTRRQQPPSSQAVGTPRETQHASADDRRPASEYNPCDSSCCAVRDIADWHAQPATLVISRPLSIPSPAPPHRSARNTTGPPISRGPRLDLFSSPPLPRPPSPHLPWRGVDLTDGRKSFDTPPLHHTSDSARCILA